MSILNNKKKKFSIKKNTKFIIYGIGNRGKFIYDSLEKKGFQVICFFDQKPGTCKNINGIPVYSIKSDAWEEYISDPHEMVIVISQQNANIHDMIAKQLFQCGFDKIIYLPMPMYQNNKKTILELRKVYRGILQNNIKENILLPCYTLADKDSSTYTDIQTVIEKSETHQIVWLPKELIFYHENNLYETLDQTPIIRLFDWFDQGIDNINSIKSEYEEKEFQYGFLGEKNFEAYVFDRFQLYKSFSLALNQGLDFFCQSPSVAIWKAQGCFSLADGNHRAAFLASKGFWKIPVQVVVKDYKAWLNLVVLNKIRTLYKDEVVQNLLFLHPYANNYTLSKYHYQRMIFKYFYRYFKGFNLKKQTILILTNTVPYYSLPFFYNECIVTYYVKLDNKALVKSFCELYFVKPMRIVDFDNSEIIPKSDIIIFDYSLVKKLYMDDCIKNIFNTNAKIIFFYHIPILEDELYIMNENYIEDTAFTYFANEKIYRMAVFSRK